MLGPRFPILHARIAGLRRRFPLGSRMRGVASMATRRRRRLHPSPRDSAFPGHRRVLTTGLRPRRTWSVALALHLAMGWRLLRREVLDLLTDGRLAGLVVVVLSLKSQLLIPTRIALP